MIHTTPGRRRRLFSISLATALFALSLADSGLVAATTTPPPGEGGSHALTSLPETLARASRVTATKQLYPDTPVAAQGRPSCVVVPGAGAAAREAAFALVRALAARTGVSPEVEEVAALMGDGWTPERARVSGRHVIALGHPSDHRLIAALWGEGYVASSDGLAGAGSWVLRTVHDPWGTGVNAIVLAANDREGFERASRALLARTEKGAANGSFAIRGPVIEMAPPETKGKEQARAKPARSGADREARGGVSSPEEMERNLDRSVLGQTSRAQDEEEARKPTFVNFTNVLANLARAWFRTGDPGYPPVMKRLIDRHRSLLSVIPKRVEMEGASADAMIWWDLVEELPVWTERDRLELTNAFLADALQGHEHTPAYELVKTGAVQVLTENHGTNSALNTFNHWRYFAKYYDLPEEAYWLQVSRSVFAGQLASHQILEDSSTYTPFCSEQTSWYALRSGDHRYFDLGIARTNMEYIMQCCYSNLGLASGFGDSHFLRFPWGINAVALIGWLERDARAKWWVDHYLPNVCGVDSKEKRGEPIDPGLEPREPVEWTGMRLFPIYRQALGRAKSSPTIVTTPKESAGRGWYNKIVFRDRWSPDAQYLILDGAGGDSGREEEPPGPSGHSQDDINTINTFTDKGRMWLIDHTYSERAIQQHSGLTITRDGEMDYKRHLARLRNAAEGPEFAVVRSTFDDYSGATWERNLFWRRGDHFAVLDRVIAEKSGHFTARCNYRALGSVRQSEGGLRLEQKGRYFQIRTAGSARSVLENAPMPDAQMWKSQYGHADAIARVFEQWDAAVLAPGEALSFATLLKASEAEAELDRTTLRRAAANLLVAESAGETFLYGLGSLPGGFGEAEVFAVGREGMLLSGLTRLGLPASPFLAASAPVDLSFAVGRAPTLRVHEPVTIVCAKGTLRFEPGEHTLDEGGVREEMAELLTRLHVAAKEESRSEAGAGTRSAQSGSGAPTGRSGVAAETKASVASSSPGVGKSGDAVPATRSLALGVPVTRALWIAWSGGTDKGWLVTGAEGLSAHGADGALRWRFAPGKPCSAMAAADVDGDGRVEVVVGSEDQNVYLVDDRGGVRWKYACKPTDRFGPPVPDAIRIEDLDRDGTPEIIVAANYVHCLRPDGTVLWEDYWRYQRGRRVGDVQSIDVADLDRDGRAEIVCAIHLNYPVALAYNAKGKRVYPADPTGQPSHKPLRIHPPMATLALDLFADGGPAQIIVGATDELNVRWTGGDRDTKRAADLPGARIALASIEKPGARPILLTATDMGAVLAHRARGARSDGIALDLPVVWRRVVGEKITALWGGVVGGRALGAAGTQSGAAHLFDGDDGRQLAVLPSGGGAAVSLLMGGDHLALVRADGSIQIMDTKNLP